MTQASKETRVPLLYSRNRTPECMMAVPGIEKRKPYLSNSRDNQADLARFYFRLEQDWFRAYGEQPLAAIICP